MNPVLQEPASASPIALARRGVVSRVLGTLPTLLTFGLLAGVAAVGHRTGWKLPKFEAIRTGAGAASDDWCDSHSVPESVCVECNETLLPKAKPHGWCRTHGVSECPTCHPDVAQLTTPAQPFPYEVASLFTLLPRAENNSRCKLYQRRIQFASPETADKIGVTVDLVGRRSMTEFISALGQITYDPTKVVHLSPRTSGTIWRIVKGIGDEVQPGELVALVDSADVGKAKTEYATAVVQVGLRTKTLNALRTAGGAIASLELRQAETSVEEARLRVLTSEQTLMNLGLPSPAVESSDDARQIMNRLRFLGIPGEWATRLSNEPGVTNNLLPMKATQFGIVTACDMVSGETIDPTKTLAILADVRQMWLTLNARQEDAKYLAVGQAVQFRPDTDTSEVRGRISWISTAHDDKTRTVRVRVEVPNADGKIKANTFGTGRVILREEPQAVVVPKEAVQWEGCCNVVFVRDASYLHSASPKVFHVRQVRPGASDETHTELLAGVLPGEVIVSKGSAALRGELLRGNLGEG